MAKKKKPLPWDDPFSAAPASPWRPDPKEAVRQKILAALRGRPHSPDEMRKLDGDYRRTVEDLRDAGHVIKSVLFRGRHPWYYCLSENGRLCGVPGEMGRDDYPSTLCQVNPAAGDATSNRSTGRKN